LANVSLNFGFRSSVISFGKAGKNLEPVVRSYQPQEQRWREYCIELSLILYCAIAANGSNPTIENGAVCSSAAKFVLPSSPS
jgi:hypothetical protein